MASKKKAYVATNINEKFIMRLGVLEAEIICKCGHKTTRANCEMRPSFFDDISFQNYFCPHCNEFICCDSQLAPIIPKGRIRIDDSECDENEL